MHILCVKLYMKVNYQPLTCPTFMCKAACLLLDLAENVKDADGFITATLQVIGKFIEVLAQENNFQRHE